MKIQRSITLAGLAFLGSFMMSLSGYADEAAKEHHVVTLKNTKVSLYGFLRLDAIHDDSRANDARTIGWILSEDPNALTGTGARKNENDMTIHARLTRFGLNFDGPTVEDLHSAKVTGNLEVDFYGNATSESRNHIRMRKAYIKLGWENSSLLFGQTADLISPLFPIVNSDLVMWGAGNLGDRRPQIRGDHAIGNIKLQAMLGLTGADDNADVDAAGSLGNGVTDGESSSTPTLQGRVAYAEGKLEVGLWGHRGWEEPDSKFNLHGPSDFDSEALGVDVNIPLVTDTWLKGEAWVGENVDDVRGGIFQGINTTFTVVPGWTTAKEIDARGGWVELGWKRTDHHSLSVGISNDNPDNKDLNAGGRAENRIAYLANRFDYGDIVFGFDYLYWTTYYIGQMSGHDNRFMAFIQYNF